MTHLHAPFAALVALLVAPHAIDAPMQGSAATKPADGDRAWPKLVGTSTELGQAIDSLKKTVTPAGIDDMTEKIVAFGKGAVPQLLESLSRQKPGSEDAARILRPLAKLVTKGDEARIAGECTHKNAQVRLFAFRKAAEIGATPALAAAKKALGDPDEEVRFEAALTCGALGSLDGLTVLHWAAREQWPLFGTRIRAAIEHHRSEEATAKMLPGLKAKEWKDVCASLRMLAGCGTKTVISEVARHLDSTDHRIKEDAINALRGIVDGEPPLEKLSAFDLAEQSTAWKKKL